ncbi:uncharacterized protein LOC119190519 [Manduca sexta]|uniref:uncharacterized protein LOC119190519 n=1 Tax=Manduca sexta TaxID=7130 RepID=UPI0018904795|nr:uncharacterized protein LOC119190519 [Manduca sexta]
MSDKEVIAPNSSDSDSSSECSSDQEGPPRKRQRRTSSRDLEERFDILSQLVSHLNNILTAKLATSTEAPPLNVQMNLSNSNNMPHTTVLMDSSLQIPNEQFLYPPKLDAGSIVNLDVSVKEPTVPKANQTRVEKIKVMQRFDSPDWNAVRYTDVQKKYTAFTELRVNQELRRLEDPFAPLRWFQMERSLAALSNAFLAQNEAVNSALQNLVDWSASKDVQLNASFIYEKLNKLVGNDSEYKTVSHDILQVICGERAEVLELRRRDIVKKLKDKYMREDLSRIPPSCGYMFDPGQLSTYLQKIGGVDKLQKQPPSSTRTRAKSPQPSTSSADAKPFRGQPNNSYKPKRAENKDSERFIHNNSSAKKRGGGGENIRQRVEDRDIKINKSTMFSGGCLKRFQNTWALFNPPNSIWKLITGLRIPFNKTPPLVLPTSDVLTKYQTPTSQLMSTEIQNLIQLKVLEPAPLTPSFISPLFIIPKSNGKSRTIFNLKALNQYMKPRHFHLFHHHQVPNFLQHGDWIVKLDLSQAYYHLPVKDRHRRFLRISYQGQLLQMTCLPYGLAAAPRIFASVTNWTAEILRKKGLRLVVYLDDYLIVHQDRNTLTAQVEIAIQFLTSLGWCINMEKSVTTPTRVIDFLGVTWDTKFNTKFLPSEKIQRIRQMLRVRLEAGSWNLKQAQRLLGHLNFATFITHRGRLHCRLLQRHSNKLRKCPRSQIQYPEEVRTELQWWMENINQKSAIHLQRMPTNHVITDASDIQWGALVNNDMIKDLWEQHQTKWHCNLKEMYTVIAAISAKAKVLQISTVILQSDNKTFVSYIKNEEGTRSRQLLDLTQQLLELVDHLNIVLRPHHLPGLCNTEADHLSRNRVAAEWHLTGEETSRLFGMWGTQI